MRDLQVEIQIFFFLPFFFPSCTHVAEVKLFAPDVNWALVQKLDFFFFFFFFSSNLPFFFPP